MVPCIRFVAFAAAAAVLAGCGAPGGGGRRSVLDATWGWGWDRRGAPQGPYADAPPAEREERLDYYRDLVRTEDAAGNPVAPVDQVRFTPDAASNAPTGAPVLPESFVGQDGGTVRLEDFRGRRNILLVFTRGFPGYICPLCTTYTAQVVHRYADIAATGTEVVLVFPGAPDKVANFVSAAREIVAIEGSAALPFPVVLDPELAHVDRFGIRGDLSKPATYIIDREGTVRYAYVGAQPHDRPDMATLVSELRRLGGK
jgi:peroxiredoxin